MNVLFVDIIRMKDEMAESLGLGSITAVLRNDGHTVKILKYRENDICMDEIEEQKADIIGFTSGSYNLLKVLETCDSIREKNKEVIICLGGYSPTFYYNEIFEKTHAVDFLIRGEGEITFNEIVNNMEKGKSFHNVNGIVYIEDKKIIVTPPREQIADLNTLPYPARDILKSKRLNLAPIESTRGCLCNCSFCSFKQFWVGSSDGKAVCFREKTPERILDEIAVLIKETNIKRVTFVDGSYELTTKYKDKLRIIAKGLLANDYNISYFISARVTFSKMLDDDYMQLLIDSGLCGIFLGVESFNQEDLNYFSKGTTVQQNIDAINFFGRFPINVDIGFINIHPYSNFIGLRENARIIHELGYAARFFLIETLILFRGTALYDKSKQDGIIVSEDIECVRKYKFIDERIEFLYEFISGYFQGLLEDNIYINAINYYFNDHYDVVYSIIKNLRDKDAVGNKFMDDYVQKLKDYQCRLNDINHEWFLKLLDLAEAGIVDNSVYEEVMCQFLPKDFLIKLEKELNANKIKLFINLQKINSNYRKLF